MVNIKRFKAFNTINEISSELRDKTIATMRDRNMNKRADKWTGFYLNKDLNEFIGSEIMLQDNQILEITNFKIGNTEHGRVLTIHLNSPKSVKYNVGYSTILYYEDTDTFNIDNILINRKTARILSKIATKMNPNSKYSKGIGDFKINSDI